MGALADVIKDQTRRRAVVDDGVAAVEAEVASKSGLSGKVIKGAFKMVKGIKPGFIGQVMDHLLDEFAGKVDPYYADAKSSGTDTVAYFKSHQDEIANALLSVTDARAVKAKNKAVQKTYKSLRPRAVGHVTAAMPRVARLVEKHAG